METGRDAATAAVVGRVIRSDVHPLPVSPEPLRLSRDADRCCATSHRIGTQFPIWF